MSVSEKHSGIVQSHVTAIERTAASRNVFIFVRPTEYDSTILIRAGYATKSMDVHHKSSNWGPMAGFVPCDPAFSKKLEGKPNPNENEHKHGAAYPVQLSLTPTLLAGHQKIEYQTGYILTPHTGASRSDIGWAAKRSSGEPTGIAAKRAMFDAFAKAGGATPEHRFCTSLPTDFGNKSTVFCLIEKAGKWLVYWVEWQGETGLLRPLRVFGYAQTGGINPVTGDYDLWMIAPHCTDLNLHSVTRIERDVHGASAASRFTMELMAEMNANCGRANNPVFNHGAEAQNYGFTQALDWNLAMFTPSGNSRMVRMNQKPGVLADLQQAGYLVVWNKRYGEADPKLSGKADTRGVAALSEIRSSMENLFTQLESIRNTADPEKMKTEILESRERGGARMPELMKNELNLMARRIGSQRNLGNEQSRIVRFHRQLLEFFGAQTSALRVLKESDFGSKFRTYESRLKPLHLKLQQALVDATTGTGESAESELTAWFAANKKDIDQIREYWT